MAVAKTWSFSQIYSNAINYISSIYACNIDETPSIPNSMKNGYELYTDTNTDLVTTSVQYQSKAVTWQDGNKIVFQYKNNSYHYYGNQPDTGTKNLYHSYGDNSNEDNQKDGTTYQYVGPARVNLTRKCVVKTSGDIPSGLKVNVPRATVKEQFTNLLKARNLTEKEFKEKTCSIRDVQAVLDTMTTFIMSKYVLWISPTGEDWMLFYDKDVSSYPAIKYEYSIVDVADKLSLEGVKTIISGIVSAALGDIKVNRLGVTASFSSSSCSSSSSSSCSSSCSSSSCSSSCSSSSCSSSCSSMFIAYMRLG